MHIVHLITRLLRAGSEENTVETIRWQLDAGHEVTLIHGSETDPYWDINLPERLARIVVPDLVHPIDSKRDFRAIRWLRDIYKTLLPNVIHTHQSKAGLVGRLAADAVPGALIVHGVHILPFEGVSPLRRAIYLAAERLAARRTDAFVGVSQAVSDAYLEAGLAHPDQMYCVRSGMALDRFRRAQLPSDWRVLSGADAAGRRPPVALMMAAFEPRKRHVPFLRAFARVSDRLPQMRLLLAGQGPEENRVRGEVQRLGLEKNVVFCGHRADAEALFALADVSVLTSVREGLPRVVVQSIAAGCPVLAQALPGLDEILAHDHNGLILPADDMGAVAHRLVDVLEDTAWRTRLARGARRTDVSDWDLARLGSGTERCYRAALGQQALSLHAEVA
ncbi:glycosyltransferase [Roseovarius phycicola]|uniref:Glycosyltransferase n=1 Tax=Roseovarius phycicola TaxID=3080976 RepID=A0ABZ2HJT6_9RHOB